MKQALLSSGLMIPRDVPIPNCQKNGVLVKVDYSCISPGTEMSSVKNAQKSLIRRAMENPEHLKNAISILKSRGINTLKNVVKGATGSSFGKALGYTAAGEIVEVGNEVNGFKIGQKVAIAGVGYANHAGYASVPKNMVIPIPENVDTKLASTVAIGGIAMQGVRRLNHKPGEKIVVIGLGAIGLITAQLLKAAGCRVIGTDLDPNRLNLAKDSLGINVVSANDPKIVEKVHMITGGIGADGVVFTAATSSSDPLSQGFNMLRKKGRLILVGVSGMNINREDIYKKELDFKIATSYGPGRYDSNYEEKGIDYPQEFVRWTENRNMEEYLIQIGKGNVKLDSIITNVFDIEEVTNAYKSFSENNKSILVLLDYKISNERIGKRDIVQHRSSTHNLNEKVINYAVIGAGSFVKGMHLPNLQQMTDKFNLKAVMSRSGLPAATLAEQFGAEYSTTNFKRILNDKEIELVVITTRHDTHASFAIEALNAGKHVFVEKPPALNYYELQKLLETIKKSGKSYMVGYNRRFSKYAEEVKKKIKDRKGNLFIEYTMNAGYLPKDHWVHGKEGGGRIIGEGCHIIDLFNYFSSSRIKSYDVAHLFMKNGYYLPDDNVSVTIEYENGTIATMNYLANGSQSYPKENMNVYFDGKKITMTDYTRLESEGINIKKIKDSLPNKGQLYQMEELYEAIKGDNKYPISLEDIEQTSVITFEISKSIDKEMESYTSNREERLSGNEDH